VPLQAETLRLAFWNVELDRPGPGLLLRDLTGAEDPQIAAVVSVLSDLDADVLVLTGVDHDGRLMALNALGDLLGAAGHPYPHRFAIAPNAGLATGLDLDGNGRTGEARDAMGYGRFAGEGGMAILSRLPVDTGGARDFSAFLWRDLPGAVLPAGMTEEVAAIQRLSSNVQAEVPILLPDGATLRLLIWHATPPVFDGPEDRNGLRNRDEAAFWLRLMEGALPFPPPEAPFVIIGQSNLDPVRGDGLPDAIRALIAHPGLQDPAPTGARGTDTADFTARGGPGTLRTDLILPSVDLRVTGAGVIWPAPDDPDLATLQAASRHRPVWVEIELP
jgi:Endonuclease/Exonuclease/phosphatase family